MCWNNIISIQTFIITLTLVIIIIKNNNYSNEKKTR